jgi:hypothetical protein
MLIVLLLLGSAFLIAAALAVLFLRMALDVLEFVCTAVLASLILIFRRPLDRSICTRSWLAAEQKLAVPHDALERSQNESPTVRSGDCPASLLLLP